MEQIFDPIRKKRVALTPDERVRQHLIKELNEIHGVPLHMMACEYHFNINGLQYRADLVAFNKQGEVILLAECKAPGVKIGRAVFDQIFRYNQKLRVKNLLISNGTKTYFATGNYLEAKYDFLTEIPHYNELSKE